MKSRSVREVMCDKKIDTDIIGSYFNFIVNVLLLNINLHWQFPRKNPGTCIMFYKQK